METTTETTTAAETEQLPDAPTELDRVELLWLSQYQLLRAQVLYKTMATEGQHASVPLVDLPEPFHLQVGCCILLLCRFHFFFSFSSIVLS